MRPLLRRNFTLASLGAGAATMLPASRVLAQGGAPPAPQTGKLIVNTYGGLWERYWRSTLVPGFTRRTGIAPVIDIGVGKIFAANLRAAGVARTPYSCVLMNENIAAQLREEGFFDPIPIDKVPALGEVMANFRVKDDLGVIGLITPIGLGYRTDLVKKPPKSWHDLWDNPEFKGRIGLYQIGAAGAQLFILLAAKLFGGSQDAWQVALRKIQELQPFPQVDFSGALDAYLTRGDIVVAPIDATEIISLKKKGVPVDFVVPDEGLLAFEVGWYLIKNAPAREEALKFLNYILEAPTQASFAQDLPGALPVNAGAQIPEAERAERFIVPDEAKRVLQWDWVRANRQLPEITEAWNRTIK